MIANKLTSKVKGKFLSTQLIQRMQKKMRKRETKDKAGKLRQSARW